MSRPTSFTVSLSVQPASLVEADLIVLPVFRDDRPDELARWNDASGGELARARASGELQAKPFETCWLHIAAGDWRCRRVLAIGAGARAELTAERVRRLAAAAGLLARRQRIGRPALVARGGLDPAAFAQATAEGFVLASFETAPYRTTDPELGPLSAATVVIEGADEAVAARAVDRGQVLGEATNIARRFSNEPSNLLTPRIFTERAQPLLVESGVSVDVLDELRIDEVGLPLLAGVARGSAEPPRVLVMRYAADGAAGAPVLGLIGKGVTFDTGGISIKSADGLDKMKHDIAGGAAVVGAMVAIARLRPSVSVVGVVPATENMPGGCAIKPGDVLRSADGKTVEVLNTDAEGRLILADALWYARQLGATHLVDVATLTGACVVALGRTTSGLFGAPDGWVELVRQTGERAGDRLWPMPLFDDYGELLKSEIADLQNISGAGRGAGAITAAAFLREFTGGLPWAHLDIAGTAWADDARPFQVKGATGVAVRTLAELPFTADRW